MNIRTIISVAVLAVGFATPVIAQEGRAFDAHAFRSDRAPAVVNGQTAVRSKAPRRAYVSDNAGRTVGNEVVAPVQATRTINVWGARFEVPAY